MPQRSSFALSGFDILLYAGVVWGWSTSWYAMTYQTVVPGETAVFWRFLLAAPLMFGLARWRGERLVYPAKMHVGLFISGLCMFSTNFILMYYAASFIPSGLLAVVFSLASIINFVLGMALFGEPFRWRLAIGGLLGVLGVAALSSPRFAGVSASEGTMRGLTLAIAGTVCFSIGNQASARLQKSGLTVLASAAWGMVYGTIMAAIYVIVRGNSFAVPLTLPFWLSSVFLILSATILAFYSYLTLLGHIGAARASYATVIFPVFALMISSMLEDYRWTPLAIVGLVLAAAGNVLILRRDPVRS
ncbi:MAG: DMT family transporter [Proteobacteria bacterium]|nr:DMT family transporter [Pseudomonadota bacterium]